MDEDTDRLIPIVGIILFFLLCGGCSSLKFEQQDNHLLHQNEWIATKDIKTEDIFKKDTC
jgi:hypothetical protein